MADTDELSDIVTRYTIPYRKEAEVAKVEERGAVRVVHIMGYPLAPSQGELVDVHFIKIGFTEASAGEAAFKEAFIAAISGHGVFGDISLDEFAGGPSYITVGGWIGSQDLALRLFGLIKHYELGEVITPAVLGIDGPEGDALAGSGMVMAQVDIDKLTALGRR